MAGYAQGVKNGVYITKKLMSALNLKDYQAVGFPGCWMCESTCDPASYNKAEKNGSFKGSSANGSGYGAGLAQWSNGWKNTIQKHFNRYTPIETWSMDQQLEIVIKLCTQTYLNMLRNCSNAAESTDIVLRGYENGSGGTSTKLRSKESMKAYTWCKKSYIPDSGYQTFSDGYVGALTSRTAWSRKILQALGNYSAADLANIGSITGSGDYSFSDGGGGGGAPPTPAEIQKMIEQYKNQYPVHSEYETYTGSGGNIFSNAGTNAFSTAVLAQDKDSKSKSYFSSKNKEHTRIYSTNDSTIILDELKLPLDTDESWANKGITEEDVKKWEKEQEKQREEAKKKQEEEKKKAEEEAKKQQNSSTNSSTNTNSSTGKNTSTNKSKNN